ncbi:hypothetical protein BaRGS_00001660 [Batillaria attramentaria]|uniref:Major facilitator superfamily (MFS) profile domain-containing protein n=1 Tax=Batillaria attramentaria TaxID=370345 RepID=A0ABD0M4F3_9CAEN
MIPELFDGPARGAVSSVGVMVLWLSLFVIGYTFPPLQEAVGPYAVLPFVGFSACLLVFFYIMQPETRASEETTEAG